MPADQRLRGAYVALTDRLEQRSVLAIGRTFICGQAEFEPEIALPAPMQHSDHVEELWARGGHVETEVKSLVARHVEGRVGLGCRRLAQRGRMPQGRRRVSGYGYSRGADFV